MMSGIKILVSGDVDGHFKMFFSKVAGIHRKKGPFEYLLCVGNFFGLNNDEWNDVKNGKILVPLTTYILGPNKKEHLKFFPDDSGELAPNIVYLGKQGVLTGSSGLKIAYLSGLGKKESNECCFSKKDISALVTSTSVGDIDILLTSEWPQGVAKYAKEIHDASNIGSASIAYLAKHLKPRYHFSGCWGIYYERLPYRNHQVLQEKQIHITRFIGLASLDNKKNLKWLYAFNIAPLSSVSSKELTDMSGPVTECPYNTEECQDLDLITDQQNQFFYDMTKNPKRSIGDSERSSSKKKQVLSVSHEQCWFCLTNPELQKQLLLSIGDHSYITLAKGGIVNDHLLIVPMEHIPSSTSLSESAEKEIMEYKVALVNYFHDQKKDVIFFERNYVSPHLQIQIVPIPKSKSSGITNTILEFAASTGLEFTELSKFSILKQVVPPKKSYFFIEAFVNKKNVGELVHIIEKKFPLQFGRMLLASTSILNMPDRVDWKECKLAPEEELEVAEAFRMNFKTYDVTKA